MKLWNMSCYCYYFLIILLSKLVFLLNNYINLIWQSLIQLILLWYPIQCSKAIPIFPTEKHPVGSNIFLLLLIRRNIKAYIIWGIWNWSVLHLSTLAHGNFPQSYELNTLTIIAFQVRKQLGLSFSLGFFLVKNQGS